MIKTNFCLHHLFQQQVERTPEVMAVIDEQQQLTYRQLDEITDKLAGYLQQQGLGTDQIAVVLMEKSVDFIIACIAVLKAGGAYLPLELAYPTALTQQIITESQPKAIITKETYLNQVKSLNLDITVLKIECHILWHHCAYDKAQASNTNLESLAYLAYSSGTTGKPKGMLGTHRGAVHSYLYRYEFSPYKVGDRVACNVFFVWEMMRPLLHGVTVYVIPEEIIYDPLPLLDFIATNQITEVLFTPSLLETIINMVDPVTFKMKMNSLRVLWLNGEVVTTHLKTRMLSELPSHTRFLNTYSISECHDVANEDLRHSEEVSSDICLVGKPIPELKLKLLDEHLQTVPQGDVGELYIGGPCLARAYLNKPNLTNKAFVMLDEERYYKTGDLAVVHPNGKLEIQGRCDFMVKIRGYSINLKAIETVLLEHGQVKSCAVLPEGNDKHLVAYVVPEEQATWKIDSRTGTCVELQSHIRPYLAHYMLPTIYVELDNIPINTSGKLDRQHLPELPRKLSTELALDKYQKPITPDEQEKVMIELWEQVLQLDSGTVHPDSNFFDFGGHSLLAAKLAILVKHIFELELKVKDIYAYPILNSLCNHLADTDKNGNGDLNSTLIEDAKLDPTIIPPTTCKPTSLDKATNVMLTGATGFLGAFMLDELLRTTRPETKIHCLVRVSSGNPSDGLKRIENNLQQYNLWHYQYEDRIVPVIGDLTKPYLGLMAEQFTQYAHTIDMIFHAGALVNYVYSYQVLKPSMVTGTHEILRLASTGITKPVHYISTNGIFPGGDTAPYMENREIDSFAERLEGGYGPAKWVAEKLVWQAVDLNLPVCIYRPGNIGHHSETGVVNPNDFQFMIIDACKKLGYAPTTDKPWAFEMTPINFLVKSVVQFARKPSFGQVYNIVQTTPVLAKAVFDLMFEKGHIFGFIPVETWEQKLLAKAEQDGDYLLDVLVESVEDVECYLLDSSRYDRTHFNQAIAMHGITEPETDIAYFRTFINAVYD